MSRKTVLVINPNSNGCVTAGLGDALSAWADHPRLRVECTTLQQGPFGIETDADIDAVAPLLLQEIDRRDDCDAFVIACYSDPALSACRAGSARPVFGMQQSAAAAAIALGGRFGVLALGPESIRRHARYLGELGLANHVVGERSLGMSVDDAANHPDALQRVIEAGRRLVSDDGAHVVILGCAGMSRHRAAAEAALGVPVIDPVQAAVMQAAGQLL